MSAKVIELAAGARPSDVPCLPPNLLRLRWRITSRSGVTISSAWIPECRFPSLSRTLKEFDGKVGSVFIDAEEISTGRKGTLFRMDGSVFKGMSYKAMFSTALGYTIVAGLNVEHTDGTVYLILRDGTVTPEQRKG